MRPIGFNGNNGDPKNVTIPGNANGANWTNITKASNPTDYGCAATGCVAADWVRLWDFNGWNQNRVLFYGGSGVGSKIYMKSYFRKTSTDPWVPMLLDSSNTGLLNPGYLAFQVHGGGRFRNPKGSWYRNIRWRELTTSGVPLVPVAIYNQKNPTLQPFSFSGQTLNGYLAENHEILVRDIRGAMTEKFSGLAGNFSYPFINPIKSWASLEVRMKNKVEYFKVRVNK